MRHEVTLSLWEHHRVHLHSPGWPSLLHTWAVWHRYRSQATTYIAKLWESKSSTRENDAIQRRSKHKTCEAAASGI